MASPLELHKLFNVKKVIILFRFICHLSSPTKKKQKEKELTKKRRKSIKCSFLGLEKIYIFLRSFFLSFLYFFFQYNQRKNDRKTQHFNERKIR